MDQTPDQTIPFDTALRDPFHALTHTPDWVKTLLTAAEDAGVYTTGFASNRRHTRGVALNIALYGYDQARQLAVVQVRQTRWRQGRYPRVRKDYYLLGYVEDGSVFAHPIASPVRSKRAMTTPEACVRYVLAQIWDCAEDELDEIRRQGDIAFVPCTLPPGAQLLEVTEVVIRGTHRITAAHLWLHKGIYYTSRRAQAVHLKGEHAPVRVNGVCRVQPGIRARVWGFTAPVGD